MSAPLTAYSVQGVLGGLPRALEGPLPSLCARTPRSPLARRERTRGATKEEALLFWEYAENILERSEQKMPLPERRPGPGLEEPLQAELPPAAVWRLRGLGRAALATRQSREKGTPSPCGFQLSLGIPPWLREARRPSAARLLKLPQPTRNP